MISKTILIILTIFLMATTAHAGLFTIYLAPSAFGNGTASPRDLSRSTMRNYLSGALQPYGHGMYHLKCSIVDGDEIEHDEFSGVNAVDLEDANILVLHHGYGLGAMFAVVPGQLDTRERTSYILRTYMNAGKASFIQFRINSSTCTRLATFLTELRERGIERNYGLTARVRYGEGTDCTALLAALLEIGGLLDPAIDSVWHRKVLVPKRLIGGPLTGNFIKPMFLTLSPIITGYWARPNDPHIVAQLYDPDGLYEHIIKRWDEGQSPLADKTLPSIKSVIGNIKGFVINATRKATPDDPMWLY